MTKLMVWFMLALLLVGSIPPILTFAQPSQGNWVVSDNEVVQNKSITLNGNLTIQSGGSLTLRNVSLSLNTQYEGQYGISVEKGGSMYIYGSKIAPSDLGKRITFVVKGNDFVMENSELQGAGWCDTSSINNCWGDYRLRVHTGLLIEGDDARIDKDVVSQNGIGIILTGSHALLEGNIIQSNDRATLMIAESNGNMVINNSFYQDPTPQESSVIALIYAQNNTFIGNRLEEQQQSKWSIGLMHGFSLIGSPRNNISSNVVSVANIAVFLSESSDALIANNTLAFGENGIYPFVSVNLRIEGNVLIGLPTPANGIPRSGIGIKLGHNSIISNNKISGRIRLGIYLDHTSNSTVLNNIVAAEPGGEIAMFLTVSKGNLIGSNNLSYFRQGIFLFGSSNGNTIWRNDVRSDHSITLDGSSSNVIYGNNFHDFATPVGGPYDNGSNTWSLQSRGNYWSHFTGQDTNGTGMGDSPYPRTTIPPYGIEPFYSTNPFPIIPSRLPTLIPIPTPASGRFPAVNANIIENQTLYVDHGYFPSVPGNLTIRNSTLILGRLGFTYVGNGGSVTIENSILIDGGYGFWIAPHNIFPGSLVIRNSRIEGAYMQDLTATSVTLENDVITDSQGGEGDLTLQTVESLRVINTTFVGIYAGIIGAVDNAFLSGNTFRDIVSSPVILWSRTRAEIQNVTFTDNQIRGSWGGGVAVCTNDSLFAGNTIANILGEFGKGASFVACGSGNLIYHNNFISNFIQPLDSGNNRWSYGGEGNYWSDYKGTDADLDGIGDTPYVHGNLNDNFPFMKPNGWLTKFYLTIATNYPSIPFQLNGTSFTTSTHGSQVLRLGYVANYQISFPQIITLSNGSRLAFVRWADGYSTPFRTMGLSSNSTIQVAYAAAATTLTMTTSTSTSGTQTTTSQNTSSISGIGSNVLLLSAVIIVSAILIALAVRRRGK